ncbi:MAG: bifunctional adenosylcobinamide kinase/adenosylcobinamide-phosphate guanylyltransferase [Tsuneonella suprasediminis]|nr:bifunctional adenosylcobinamide kinase/adenosylcobinamide-phosphate guanylyltransferase [Altererythrobacter sp. N1]
MSGHSLFVVGGARSGKSRYAQARAEAVDGRHVFIATAQAFDAEMHDRIARHRAERDARWHTVEASVDLAAAITAYDQPDSVILIDCLTLWVSNLLMADADVTRAVEDLRHTIQLFRGTSILVSNEVGMGIVPDNPLARQFRDDAGRTNQLIAAAASEVQLVVAGLPMKVK